MCVQLLSGELARDIDLQLMVETAGLQDFSSLPTYSFPSGSVGQLATVCEGVLVDRDGIVEDTEQFLLSLLSTAVDVRTGESAVVTIQDSPLDSKSLQPFSAHLQRFSQRIN